MSCRLNLLRMNAVRFSTHLQQCTINNSVSLSCQVSPSIENIFTQQIYRIGPIVRSSSVYSHFLFELSVLISKKLGDKFVIFTFKRVNSIYDTYLMQLFVLKWIVAWPVAATPTILLIMAGT